MEVTKTQLLYLCPKLGNDYYVTRIDFENVIIKDIRSEFQFEISFLNPLPSRLKANIYVWQMKDAVRIIEQIYEIKTLPKLKKVLNELTNKYNSMNISDIQY